MAATQTSAGAAFWVMSRCGKHCSAGIARCKPLALQLACVQQRIAVVRGSGVQREQGRGLQGGGYAVALCCGSMRMMHASFGCHPCTRRDVVMGWWRATGVVQTKAFDLDPVAYVKSHATKIFADSGACSLLCSMRFSRMPFCLVRKHTVAFSHTISAFLHPAQATPSR